MNRPDMIATKDADAAYGVRVETFTTDPDDIKTVSGPHMAALAVLCECGTCRAANGGDTSAVRFVTKDGRGATIFLMNETARDTIVDTFEEVGDQDEVKDRRIASLEDEVERLKERLEEETLCRCPITEHEEGCEDPNAGG